MTVSRDPALGNNNLRLLREIDDLVKARFDGVYARLARKMGKSSTYLSPFVLQKRPLRPSLVEKINSVTGASIQFYEPGSPAATLLDDTDETPKRAAKTPKTVAAPELSPIAEVLAFSKAADALSADAESMLVAMMEFRAGSQNSPQSYLSAIQAIRGLKDVFS